MSNFLDLAFRAVKSFLRAKSGVLTPFSMF